MLHISYQPFILIQIDPYSVMLTGVWPNCLALVAYAWLTFY